jgi:hypothetical protein
MRVLAAKNLFSVVAASLLVTSHAADEKPLDVQIVINAVAKSVWKKGEPKADFFISGSYAAALKMHEFDGTFLPYNDIDVFVQHPSAEELDVCSESVPFRIVETDTVWDLLPEKEVPINIIALCELRDPVHHSDINAVAVGFKVTASYFSNSPTITSWTIDDSFHDFMVTKTLRIREDVLIVPETGDYVITAWGGNLGRKLSDIRHRSVLRLLAKADDLNLKYDLPNEDNLKTLLSGQSMSSKDMTTLLSLHGTYQAEIWDRFNVYEVTKMKEKRYLITDKDESVVFPPPDGTKIGRTSLPEAGRKLTKKAGKKAGKKGSSSFGR